LKGPEFSKVNPSGAVPASVDDGFASTQNVAISEYSAEQAPQAKSSGDGSARSRADVRRWLGFINSDIHKTFSMIFGAGRFLNEEGPQQESAASASKIRTRSFAMSDAQLINQPYSGGEAPSIADAYLYVVSRWAHAKQVDSAGQDHSAAFFKRMEDNAGVKAALKAEGSA
ncbi:hypothetical protein OY671_010235, partial [Metschnikowia pulcherrima]